MIYEDDFMYVGHMDRNEKPNYLGHLIIDLKKLCLHLPA